jgi:integrase/recombinase XerD
VNALETLAAEHLKALAAHGYAVHTQKNRRAHLRQFTTWCELRGITTAPEITREALELYRHWLYERRTKEGKPLAWGTQAQKLVAVRQWLAWLAKTERLLHDPASALELPKLPRRLPRAVLSASEAEAVLARPDAETTLGLRDRAILEVLYSTGIRRAELAGLLLPDVDFERGILLVREGKGGKDRFVPVGERALVWVEIYLNRARPRLARGRDPGHLFLTSRGGRFHTNRLSELVRGYIAAADLGKSGSCHVFRHTAATLMLEGGADIRDIQELLGHDDLSSTQVYTRVSIQRLKAVHARTHPAAAPARPDPTT